MQVTGEFRFQGPREDVWALLNDPAVLARCVPGCEELNPTGPDEYRTRVKVGLAAVKGTYQGTVRITDKQEPSAMTLMVEMSGTTGFVKVAGHMDLASDNGATVLAYDWDVAVGGPVAMVGQRVLSGVAKWIIGEFFGTAQKELAGRLAG